jgi:hypothetical protein
MSPDCFYCGNRKHFVLPKYVLGLTWNWVFRRYIVGILRFVMFWGFASFLFYSAVNLPGLQGSVMLTSGVHRTPPLGSQSCQCQHFVSVTGSSPNIQLCCVWLVKCMEEVYTQTWGLIIPATLLLLRFTPFNSTCPPRCDLYSHHLKLERRKNSLLQPCGCALRRRPKESSSLLIKVICFKISPSPAPYSFSAHWNSVCTYCISPLLCLSLSLKDREKIDTKSQ